jgi:single-strand DNA-binding protein
MSDITTIGNIGEPQLKWTSGGKAVLEFPLAENHSKKNAQGGWDDDGTTWRRVTVWDKKAEVLAEALNKGDRVIVTGAERLREYTAKDGSTGKSLEVTAREVGIIPRAPQQQQSYAPPAASAQSDPWAQGHGSAEVPF